MATPCNWNRLFFFFLVFLNGFEPCFTSSKRKSLFSTKTPYKWVHPQSDSVTEDDLNNLPDFEGKSCSAIHASLVARHGTRFPGVDDVNDIGALHDRVVPSMEPDTNDELYNWKNRFPSNNDKALAHIGEEELEELGKRIATRLSTLFADEDLANFRFIASSQQRAKQSAASFYEGFINTVFTEEEDFPREEFESEIIDEMMRFFDLCGRYVYAVKENKTAMKEYFSFMNSETIIKIKDSISQKLKVDSGLFSTADVRLVYVICGYEKAIYGQSPWCSLLDEEDLIPLEYLGDLKHYYKNGHGHNITWQQSCPLVSEIFSAMDEVIVEIENAEDDEEMDGYVVGQFAFGHAETLGPLFSALGLYNDSLPLKAENYADQGDRTFRTSEILPFGSNILFVLYECVAEEFAEVEEVEEVEYYLKVLVNEKPVILPGCEKEYCDFHKLRKQYEGLVDYCDFKKICKRSVPKKDEL